MFSVLDSMKRQPPVLLFFWSRNSNKRRLINDSGNEVVKGGKLENRDLEVVEFFKSLQDKLRIVVEAEAKWYLNFPSLFLDFSPRSGHSFMSLKKYSTTLGSKCFPLCSWMYSKAFSSGQALR